MTEIQRSASYDTIADGATHDICDGADGKQSDSVAGDAAAAHSTNGVKASAKATATITPCRAAVAGDDDAVDDKPVQWRRIMHYQQVSSLCDFFFIRVRLHACVQWRRILHYQQVSSALLFRVLSTHTPTCNIHTLT
jgi:hypothetical protein